MDMWTVFYPNSENKLKKDDFFNETIGNLNNASI